MGGTAEKRPPPPTARFPNAPLQPGFARAVDRACSAFTAPRAHELWKTAGRPVGTLSGRDRGPRRRPTALRVEAPAPAAEGPLLGALGRELAAPRALCPPPRLCVSNLPGADLTSVFKGRGEGDNRKPRPVRFEHIRDAPRDNRCRPGVCPEVTLGGDGFSHDDARFPRSRRGGPPCPGPS